MSSLCPIGKKNHEEVSRSPDVRPHCDVATRGVRMTREQTRIQSMHVQEWSQKWKRGCPTLKGKVGSRGHY